MDRETIIIGILILIIIILLIISFVNLDNYSYNTSTSYNTIPMESETEHLIQNIHNKDRDIRKHKLCLYHTTWCGACTRFKPTWENFISQNKTDIQIESVDCDINKDKCKSILGYPTIILHKKDGIDIVFNGNQTVEAINQFIKNNN